MNPEKVLITGVAGFLGSRVAAALLRAGWNVVGLDDLSASDRARLEEFSTCPAFRFEQGSIEDAALLRDLMCGAGWVLHFAERKIPRYQSSYQTLQVNCRGAERVLEESARAGCRVLFGSTAEVYGKNPETPFNEETAPVLGRTWVNRWSYAISKLYGEHLCYAFREESKLSMRILRFGNLYGPGERRDWMGGPQAVFIESALTGQPMPIHHDGGQTRTFLYVDDAVSAVLLCLERPHSEGEILNIASESAISMVDLAWNIWRLAGADGKPRIEFIPYTEFSREYEDVRHRHLATSKARSLLGFEARTALEDGLRHTIAWHREKTGWTASPQVPPASTSSSPS